MRGQMMDFPLTLTSILERAGALFARREICSRLPDKSIHRTDYRAFHRRARALGEALTRAGLRRGDRVATLMWNHAWHLEAYFGIPAAGGVLHTLNLRLHPDDIAYIAGHADDRFLIVDDVLWPIYEPWRDKHRFERVIVVPLTGKPVPPGTTSYEDFIAGASSEWTPPALDENEAAGMCYTSGTTGKPKGVLYSHRAIVLHTFAAGLVDTLALCQRDVITPVVPMFHANAWGLPFTAVMVGAKIALPGPHLAPDLLLDLFQEEKVTMSAGVPTIWMGMLDAMNRNPGRWKTQPGLRMAVGGSAPPESMIREFDRLGWKLIQAWGMTETAPLGTVSYVKDHLLDRPLDEQYAYRAKQGIPAPFVECRVVAEGGPAPWDGKSMGELQVRGPWVAGSYYRLDDTEEKWTADGWFRTGDVATIDGDGYVKLTDRTKDLIKSGGEWISSVDLENALMGHPDVKEAAVIAVPHPKWDERPLAVIVRESGRDLSEADLRAYLEGKIAKWWMPDAFVFIDEIPRTSTGKFLKAALRDRYKDWRWS